MKRDVPQVTIGVSNKKACDLLYFKEVFGGNIYFDKSSNGFKWSIQSKVDLLSFLEYIKKHPCYSKKKARLHLLPRFFEYKQDRIYNSTSHFYFVQDEKSDLAFQHWDEGDKVDFVSKKDEGTTKKLLGPFAQGAKSKTGLGYDLRLGGSILRVEPAVRLSPDRTPDVKPLYRKAWLKFMEKWNSFDSVE
jgi:hypothetical protein